MKWLLKLVSGTLGWLFTLLLTGFVLAAVAVLLIFQYYSKDLPDYSTLERYDPPTVTRLYAADGRLLAEYATEKRVFVPLSAIPRRVIDAFLSAEDKNFYAHGGVDVTGIVRAVYTNILNYGHGRSLVGGSTITQQVVKNFLLTDEKSLERKIKEAILALRISRVYSKDKILELYLNEIYLGLRSYGIAAAALNYFNKSLDELSIEEAALLAAMPKAPATYDPRRNAEAAKQRRDWVLSRMAEDGHISPQALLQAQAQPITLRARDPDDVARADFFAEEVRRWLAEHYGANVLYEGGLVVKTTLDPALQRMADRALRAALIDYDRRRGYRGPLHRIKPLEGWQEKLAALARQEGRLIEGQRLAVVMALDERKATIAFEDGKTGVIPHALLSWTRRVLGDGVLGPEARRPADILAMGDVVIAGPVPEEAAKKLSSAEAKTAWDLQQVPEVNGAFVVMDPHTGRVLAMSGGYAYAGTEFNRATQAKRQPGSAFKPFVYLAGLEHGFTPSTIVLDAPVELSQGAGLPTWKPQNYKDEYLGPATLRVGLEKSRNTMTVRLGQAIGIDRVLEIGRRFGIYDQLPRNFSVVLGAAETTLLRLTNAYATLVNGGKKVQPALVERIDDRHGRTIFRRDMRICNLCQVREGIQPSESPPLPADDREQVVDPRLAYQMVSILEGAVQRGTGVRARALGRPVAGKTGTTNDSMDTWFIGFTPDLVAGVYVGHDQPKTLGAKETGGSVALPAFVGFMQQALDGRPAPPFRIPRGIQLVRVDLRSGQPVELVPEASAIILEAFVTGEPVFLPATARALSPARPPAAAATAPPGTSDSFQRGPEEGTMHIIPAPVPVADPTTSPVTGTGGLY